MHSLHSMYDKTTPDNINAVHSLTKTRSINLLATRSCRNSFPALVLVRVNVVELFGEGLAACLPMYSTVAGEQSGHNTTGGVRRPQAGVSAVDRPSAGWATASSWGRQGSSTNTLRGDSCRLIERTERATH